MTVVAIPGSKPIVLAQDRDIVQGLEAAPNLTAQLAEKGRAEYQGMIVLLRSFANYQPDRVVYECFAFKAGGGNP